MRMLQRWGVPEASLNRRKHKSAGRSASAALGISGSGLRSPFDAIPQSPDERRYNAYLAGTSPEELAARENVRLVTIQRSIDAMAARRQRFSEDALQTTMREMAMSQLPAVAQAIKLGLEAVIELKQTEVDASGQSSTLYIQKPDHATHWKAIQALESLIEVIQPRTPQVQVNANSSTNIQQNTLHAVGVNGQPLSSESIIRQIRHERGLALPLEDAAAANPDEEASMNADVDMELAQELAEEDAEEEENGEGEDTDEDESGESGESGEASPAP